MVWMDLYRLPKERQALILKGLTFVRGQARPAEMFVSTAHSGEIEHWYETDLSSPEAFAETVYASNFIALSVGGFAYYLPGLLCLCLLRTDGHFQAQLLRRLRETRYEALSVLEPPGVGICTQVVEIMKTVAWTNDRSLIDTYPGLSIAADPEAEAIYEEILLLSEELAKHSHPSKSGRRRHSRSID